MIDVRTFHTMEELAPFRAELDQLSRESPRRSPFSTLAYAVACLAADPSLAQECTPWICAAFEDARPIGYLALRLVPERSGGMVNHKLEHLATCGVDRPHLVARQKDEARSAEAIIQHLANSKGWSFLKLTQQDLTSELRGPIRAMDSVRYYQRELEDRQTTSVPIVWGTLAEYVRALSGRHRSHVKRMTLDTLSLGKMTALRSSNPEALPALLELYLSIEKRSWKGHGEASMSGSPWRERLTRWMMAHGSPMALTIEILLDDDHPVCGTITGDYEGSVYFLYTAFDDAYRAVAPGAAMLLFGIERAILGGFTAFNMLPDYAYYKRRWLGAVTETKTIQVYRTLSALHAKARLGEIHRWLTGGDDPAAELFNPERRAVVARARNGEAEGDEQHPAPPPMKSAASPAERAWVAEIRAMDGALHRTAEQLLRATPFADAKRAAVRDDRTISGRVA